MRNVIYTIWCLIPLFFFLVFLWGFLERVGGKTAKGSPADTLRQGLFVLACVILSILIDQYVLADLVDSLAPDYLPLEMFQVILLPAVLFIGAKILGPSKQILISKAPTPTKGRRR